MTHNPIGPACGSGGGFLPGSSTLPGVVASVVIDANSVAFQDLRIVPAGKRLIVESVILRTPSGDVSLIEGSLGAFPLGTSWAAFPVQSGLTGLSGQSIIYPSAVGSSTSFTETIRFGIILSTACGVAGRTLTVEVIGREV